MNPADSAIVTVLSQILGWLLLRGVSTLIGKWSAYFQIAWENTINEEARSSYAKKLDELKAAMPGKSAQWDQWRVGARADLESHSTAKAASQAQGPSPAAGTLDPARESDSRNSQG